MEAIKSGMRRLSQGVIFSDGGQAQPGYATMADDDDSDRNLSVEVPVISPDGQSQETSGGRRLSVEMQVSENTDSIVQAKIPEGVKPGESVVVHAPTGKKLRVRVPPGYSAGDMIFVPVPKDDGKTDGLVGWARRRMSLVS